jgi:hypothetical protein
VPELRNVRVDQAVAAFERAGGVTRRSKHIVIKMPNGQTLAFSRNRQPIKIGILRAMIKKAGLTEEQFAEFL